MPQEVGIRASITTLSRVKLCIAFSGARDTAVGTRNWLAKAWFPLAPLSSIYFGLVSNSGFSKLAKSQPEGLDLTVIVAIAPLAVWLGPSFFQQESQSNTSYPRCGLGAASREGEAAILLMMVLDHPVRLQYSEYDSFCQSNPGFETDSGLM
jgi:hypothetical protein